MLIQMDSLLTIARDAAHTAGQAILTYYDHAHADLGIKIKDDNSLVTLADTKANTILFEMLGETQIPILSEEALGYTLPYPERLWIIDPLDGTKGFLNHTDDFSVMIALIEHGRPVLAVVDAPVLQKQYFALRGGGSYLTDGTTERTLTVSTRTIPDLRGIVSVNHAAPYMFTVCETLNVTETIAIGSIGIKAGYMAEDLGDFYLTRGALGEWDVCAPELILTEAGGTATDTHGAPLFYGNVGHRIQHGIVFSNGVVHKEVLDALAKS